MGSLQSVTNFDLERCAEAERPAERYCEAKEGDECYKSAERVREMGEVVETA